MNNNTPTLSSTSAAVEAENFRMAVAVVAEPPMLFTCLAHRILNRALEIGLRDRGMSAACQLSFFRPAFSLHQFEINNAAKKGALDCLRSALEDVHFFQRSVIASFSADERWVVFHPSDVKGRTFEELFLTEKYVSAALADLKNLEGQFELWSSLSFEDMTLLLQNLQSEK